MELVYREPLQLPGEFFTPIPDSNFVHHSDFLVKLKIIMYWFTTSTGISPWPQHTLLSKNLKTISQIFLRADHVKPPLESPYPGPNARRSEKNNYDYHRKKEMLP